MSPSCASSPSVTRSLSVARGFTRDARARRQGRFCPRASAGGDLRPCGSGDVRLRPAGADRRGRKRLGEDGLPEPAAETFTAPALRFDSERAEGVVRFTVSGLEAPTAVCRCSSRPRTPGFPPTTAAGWVSATPAAAHKTAGIVRNVISGAISSDGEEQIRICVSVPVGDVALDL